MAIWQAMKGDSQTPNRFWNRRDLKHRLAAYSPQALRQLIEHVPSLNVSMANELREGCCDRLHPSSDRHAGLPNKWRHFVP